MGKNVIVLSTWITCSLKILSKCLFKGKFVLLVSEQLWHLKFIQPNSFQVASNVGSYSKYIYYILQIMG